MLFVGLALTLAVWGVEPAFESIYSGGEGCLEQVTLFYTQDSCARLNWLVAEVTRKQL